MSIILGQKRGNAMLKDGFYNMDCFEGFRQINDKSVDMILCDLPYGTTQCSWDAVLPLNSYGKSINGLLRIMGQFYCLEWSRSPAT